MGRSKRIVLLTVLFLCIFSIIFIYSLVKQNGTTDNNIYDNAEFTSKYNNNLSNCGWIPNWAAGDGLAILKANANILDCISPVLYEAKDDGSLNNISPSNLNEIISFANNNGIKIYPTITLFWMFFLLFVQFSIKLNRLRTRHRITSAYFRLYT